eukprot:TRINITY_DN2834_c0_g2_i1.p1 TRINITY_DN2834_c0_g2~~TRINITY_DN2834_c0_g2_i1.p1  ORF type:complete len:340 (-),score=72.06 TRINITY_DN2834_c0_g2_i1:617-1636(-)
MLHNNISLRQQGTKTSGQRLPPAKLPRVGTSIPTKWVAVLNDSNELPKAFGQSSQRFQFNKSRSKIPGPGTYDTTSQQMNKKIVHSLDSAPVRFSYKQRVKPGPGDYEVPRPFTGPSSYSQSAAFRSNVPRGIQSYSNTHSLGPGEYTSEIVQSRPVTTYNNLKTKSVPFGLKTNRFDIENKSDVPPVGAYNLLTKSSKESKGKTISKVSVKKEPVESPLKNWKGSVHTVKEEKDTPGPGYYNQSKTFLKKDYTPSAVFRYAKYSAPSDQYPGPGEYNIDRDQMNRKKKKHVYHSAFLSTKSRFGSNSNFNPGPGQYYSSKPSLKSNFSVRRTTFPESM